MTPAARCEKNPPMPDPARFCAGFAAAAALGGMSLAGASFAAEAAGFTVEPGALAEEAAFAPDGDPEALEAAGVPLEGALPEDAVADGAPDVDEAAEALELAPAIGGCEAGLTSVALRSSVACGRFAAELSVRPASFAGSGLSVMGAGSPGAYGQAAGGEARTLGRV